MSDVSRLSNIEAVKALESARRVMTNPATGDARPGCSAARIDVDRALAILSEAKQLEGAVSRVAELEAERQAVLDAVNLYGDETLHKALDAIGWPSPTQGGSDG